VEKLRRSKPPDARIAALGSPLRFGGRSGGGSVIGWNHVAQDWGRGRRRRLVGRPFGLGTVVALDAVWTALCPPVGRIPGLAPVGRLWGLLGGLPGLLPVALCGGLVRPPAGGRWRGPIGLWRPLPSGRPPRGLRLWALHRLRPLEPRKAQKHRAALGGAQGSEFGLELVNQLAGAQGVRGHIEGVAHRSRDKRPAASP
jgi:hypothetical protein